MAVASMSGKRHLRSCATPRSRVSDVSHKTETAGESEEAVGALGGRGCCVFSIGGPHFGLAGGAAQRTHAKAEGEGICPTAQRRKRPLKLGSKLLRTHLAPILDEEMD